MKDNAKKKKIIIGVIAGVLAVAVAVTCIVVFSGKSADGKKDETKPTEAVTEQATEAASETVTEKATEKATEKETQGPTETVKKASFDDIVKKGYEKIGAVKLYNHINQYKGAKILTAVQIKDIGNTAVYATVGNDNKIRCYYQFVFNKKDEFKEVKKNEYAAIYGVVSKKGVSAGTIQINDCHIAAVGKEAKDFYDTIKDEQIVDPTEKPTSAPATAAPTSAPATAAPATEAPTSPDEDMKIVYDEGGVKLGYKKTVADDMSVDFIFYVENNSGKALMMGAQDSTVNGKEIDLLAMIFLEDGESEDSEIFALNDDLDEAGITKIDEISFKLVMTNIDDFDDTEVSDIITVKI